MILSPCRQKTVISSSIFRHSQLFSKVSKSQDELSKVVPQAEETRSESSRLQNHRRVRNRRRFSIERQEARARIIPQFQRAASGAAPETPRARASGESATHTSNDDVLWPATRSLRQRLQQNMSEVVTHPECRAQERRFCSNGGATRRTKDLL